MDIREFELCFSINNSSDESDDLGLDGVEQERSLARASDPDLQEEFCDINPRAATEVYKEIERERKARVIHPWEQQRVQAFCRKVKILRG